MQIFMPFSDVVSSLKSLDNKRLGKQRVEARWIIDIIQGIKQGQNHPIIGMYRNYLPALIYYYNTCLEEFAARGYHNDKLQPIPLNEDCIVFPWFWNDEIILDRQKAILVFKDPTYYTPSKGFDVEPVERCFYIINNVPVDYQAKHEEEERRKKERKENKKEPKLKGITKKNKKSVPTFDKCHIQRELAKIGVLIQFEV